MLYYIGRMIGWIGYLGNKYICSVIAIVFPFYMSFLALNTEDIIDDDIQILSFWIIFGYLNCIEFYMEWLIRWVPFYYWIKTIGLLWLIFPIKIFNTEIGGSHVVYKAIIEKYLSKYEDTIDEYLSKVGITFEEPVKGENTKKKVEENDSGKKVVVEEEQEGEKNIIPEEIAPQEEDVPIIMGEVEEVKSDL